MTDPQQELYSHILVALKDKYGDMVYDGALPPDGTPYPFIYLGDLSFTDSVNNKSQILGRASVTIHVWHDNVHKRGTVSKYLGEIKQICMQMGSTGNFSWRYATGGMTRILPDNSTGTPLLHGFCQPELILMGGRY